jgi:hypothetical protein
MSEAGPRAAAPRSGDADAASRLKADADAAHTARDFERAVFLYTEALALEPSHVLHSNSAASLLCLEPAAAAALERALANADAAVALAPA